MCGRMLVVVFLIGVGFPPSCSAIAGSRSMNLLRLAKLEIRVLSVQARTRSRRWAGHARMQHPGLNIAEIQRRVAAWNGSSVSVTLLCRTDSAIEIKEKTPFFGAS